MKYTAGSLEEMQKIASDFIHTLLPKENKATIVGLSGDLGAGKTSFSQGVARALGIDENVVSPTFVIMKRYDVRSMMHEERKGIQDSLRFDSRTSSFDQLIHIDAYRLERSEELTHLGWKEVISNPQNLILIEWPEKVQDIMPAHTRITFTHVSPEVREVEIVGL